MFSDIFLQCWSPSCRMKTQPLAEGQTRMPVWLLAVTPPLPWICLECFLYPSTSLHLCLKLSPSFTTLPFPALWGPLKYASAECFPNAPLFCILHINYPTVFSTVPSVPMWQPNTYFFLLSPLFLADSSHHCLFSNHSHPSVPSTSSVYPASSRRERERERIVKRLGKFKTHWGSFR